MAELYNATDADYNASSRVIYSQIEIYFDAIPVVVTQDDYLVDWDLLEEVGSDDISIIGNTSANELIFSLLNENGRFNVSNLSGPYYGKFRKGIKVIPYIRTEATKWIQLGEFFVNDWSTTITGLEATVTCYDKLDIVFNAAPVSPPVTKNTTLNNAYQSIFNELGIVAAIDPLTDVLDWWYTLENNKLTLQELSAAGYVGCYCDRDGTIIIKNLVSPKDLRSTITDTNQLISADTTQTLNDEYDGLKIMMNQTQLVSQDLLTVNDLVLEAGVTTSQVTKVNAPAVERLHTIILKFDTAGITLFNYILSSHEIQYLLENTTPNSIEGSITFTGNVIKTIESEYYKSGTKSLQLNNKYVQNEAMALKQQIILDRHIAHGLPYLDIETRGNPLLKLGDKIKIQSTYRSLMFTGIILRQEFSYRGSLACKTRLINADILGVI